MWRWLVLVALLGLQLFGYQEARHYGDKRYQQGRQEVIDAVAETNARQAQSARAVEIQHQEKIDELALQDRDQAEALAARLRAVTADRDSLQQRIARSVAATARPADQAAAPASATGQPDATAAALGGISVACGDLAAGLAGDAERLADAVRGLQSYAREVAPAGP